MCFGLTALEVNLNKCKKHFAKSQPEAAKLISVAREMHALDILSYKHGDSLACLNVSQSLNCMPIVASPDDLLPCLTWETKLQTPALLWCSLCWSVSTCNPRPCYKILLQYTFWGHMENSWCSQRSTRTSPASWLGGKFSLWWAFPFTGCLGWIEPLKWSFGSIFWYWFHMTCNPRVPTYTYFCMWQLPKISGPSLTGWECYALASIIGRPMRCDWLRWPQEICGRLKNCDKCLRSDSIKFEIKTVCCMLMIVCGRVQNCFTSHSCNQKLWTFDSGFEGGNIDKNKFLTAS